MDHNLELIIPRLEILEIEVCNILYNPGNIGKRIFSIQSYPGNSGSYDPYSVLSWKYWIVRSILSPSPAADACQTHIMARILQRGYK